MLGDDGDDRVAVSTAGCQDTLGPCPKEMSGGIAVLRFL